MKRLMRKFAVALAALIGPVSWYLPAQASTIDTFDFAIANSAATPTTNWHLVSNPTTSVEIFLTGSFTGVVEGNGFIELGDLQSFSATLANGGFPTNIATAPTDLSLFSYDTVGGTSSLDFASNSSFFVCVGAAASLDSQCGAGTVPYPTGTIADALPGSPYTSLGDVFATGQPVITLVSSVTTPPATVPEPATLVLLATGIAGMLGLIRARIRA